jgi:hypothetical protein
LNDLDVKCYSGHTLAERPVSFRWQGSRHVVEEVEGAWLEPGSRCFRVCTEGGGRFCLCYNETEGQWSLTELQGADEC